MIVLLRSLSSYQLVNTAFLTSLELARLYSVVIKTLRRCFCSCCLMAPHMIVEPSDHLIDKSTLHDHTRPSVVVLLLESCSLTQIPNCQQLSGCDTPLADDWNLKAQCFF